MPEKRVHGFGGVDTALEPYLRDPREALQADDARNVWMRKGSIETRPGVELFIPAKNRPGVLVPEDPEVNPDPSIDWPVVDDPDGDPPPSPSINDSGSVTPLPSSLGPSSQTPSSLAPSSQVPSTSESKIPCGSGNLRVTFSGMAACSCWLGRAQIMDPNKINRQWCAPVFSYDPETEVTTWRIDTEDFAQFNITKWDDTPPYCEVNPQPLSHTFDLIVTRNNSNPSDVIWNVLASGNFEFESLALFNLVNATGAFNEVAGANEVVGCPDNLMDGAGSVSCEVAP
jgi:hypothetical protein